MGGGGEQLLQRRIPMRYLLLLVCCLVAALPLNARAQVGEAIGRILDDTNIRRAPPPPPDFVVKTRPDPDALHYTPLQTPEPTDRTPKKTPAELEAIGAELSRAAAANKEKAARIKTPDAGLAATPAPKSTATKQRGEAPRAN
jgi:hypothetical protein